MNKKILLIIIVAALIVAAGLLAYSFLNKPKISPDEIVLFYGEDCPHCKLVEDFITQNKVEEKVSFTRLEVPFGEKTSPQLVENAKVLLEKLNACGLKTEQVGIPFLWDGKTCIIGDQDIISFFSQKTK